MLNVVDRMLTLWKRRLKPPSRAGRAAPLAFRNFAPGRLRSTVAGGWLVTLAGMRRRVPLAAALSLMAGIAAVTPGQAAVSAGALQSSGECGPVLGGAPPSDPPPTVQFQVELARRIVTYGDAFAFWSEYSWSCFQPRPAGDPRLELRAVGERVFRPAGGAARLLARSEPLNAEATAGVVTWEIKPALTAEYRVWWSGWTSEPSRMVVRPALVLRRTGRVLSLRIVAARDYTGRRVFVQRRRLGRWKTTGTLLVRAGSQVRFRAEGDDGRLRVFVPSAFGYAYAVRLVQRA